MSNANPSQLPPQPVWPPPPPPVIADLVPGADYILVWNSESNWTIQPRDKPPEKETDQKSHKEHKSHKH